jgi:acyl phosphate:glycerol-3-phosphate acyltransferase
VGKGAVGPLLAGRDRPVLAAVAATAGMAGHNWSPWLGGAGGRGVSVALGALTAQAWPGTVVLAVGLAAGRLSRQTGLGTLVAAVALVPVVARTHGRGAALAGAGLAGNHPPAEPGWATYAHRLLFDHDPAPRSGPPAGLREAA